MSRHFFYMLNLLSCAKNNLGNTTLKYFSYLIAFSSLTILSHAAFAKIWIVDSNPGNQARNFTTLQAAHDSSIVQSGDTLYLSGSAIGYGNLITSKQLHIFGPGYFLIENDSIQAKKNDATTGRITFQSGSDRSTIAGCYINGQLDISANNITIERNRIFHYGNIPSFNINGVSNIKVAQNYIGGGQWGVISIKDSANNLIIVNNNIYHVYWQVSSSIIQSNLTCENIVVGNNVLYGGVALNNAVITDNILRAGTYSGSNNTILNNICNGTQFPASGNNQQNVNMATVFVGTGSTDGQWKLKAGSPAIGTGTNGTDIGMFGGSTPYVLSGIPAIPTIYQFIGPSTGSQSLPVQLKIKSRR